MKTCQVCFNSGEVECHYCAGRGFHYIDKDGKVQIGADCANCDGTGLDACEHCYD